MWRAHTNRKPAFFWQGVLIVMPVAVLATLGFVSLRQDRLLAQREAAERAQGLAEELAPKIWNDLSAVKASDAPPGPSFLVDSAGGLLFPPPCPPLPPAQPFNPAELNPAQAALWLAELGGYTGKWSGGPPGSTTIGRGLERVLHGVEAVLAMRG